MHPNSRHVGPSAVARRQARARKKQSQKRRRRAERHACRARQQGEEERLERLLASGELDEDLASADWDEE